jgi:hypothetical protein
MQKGISLSELAAKIEGNQATKKDFVADTRSMGMQVVEPAPVEIQAAAVMQFAPPNEGDKPAPSPSTELRVGDHGRFPVNNHAHGQIASRLKIPLPYYRRMQAEKPQLLAANVNTWLANAAEKRMVRTMDGDVRAFLSDRYQRIENEEIAEVALPILAEIPDVQIVSAEITDKRMYIQAVAPRIEGEVKVGDAMQAGVVISNSEVGSGTVSIASMFWRLWCLNGCTTEKQLGQRHVGGRVAEGDVSFYQDDTIEADDRAILLKVRDAVKHAISEDAFQATLAKMRGLAEIKIEGNPTKAVEVLTAKVKASQDEGQGILRSLIEGGDLSAWGLLNAVTAQAHNVESYDRAVEFEQVGGQLLDLAPNQWNEILLAA